MFKIAGVSKTIKTPKVGVKKTLNPLSKMKRAIPGFKNGGHVDHEVMTNHIHCACKEK